METIKKHPAATLLIALAIALAICIAGTALMLTGNKGGPAQPEEYSPQLNPADFVSYVNNPYFALIPGMIYTYEGVSEDGIERIEVAVLNETRMVAGIRARVVHDLVWKNGNLIEDTLDWYAQDKKGNVWYLGEDSKEIVAGKVASTKGSWETGVDGAKPGIIMKASPVAGEPYRQEYYKGEAEDMAMVTARSVNVSVAYRNYTGCLQTKEWNPLEEGSTEFKYYCPEAGGLILETSEDGSEVVQLIRIRANAEPLLRQAAQAEPLKKALNEADAIRIAEAETGGRATDVALEEKFGMITYVVEIQDAGEEKDVVINPDTGAILSIET